MAAILSRGRWDDVNLWEEVHFLIHINIRRYFYAEYGANFKTTIGDIAMSQGHTVLVLNHCECLIKLTYHNVIVAVGVDD